MFLVCPKNSAIEIRIGKFVLFAMIILAVFRSSSMADYENYALAFDPSEQELRFEPLFKVIKGIASLFSNSAFIGFAIYAFASILIRWSVIKITPSLILASLLVYQSNIYIAQDQIAIRAGLASALLLLAFYLKERDNKKGSVIVSLLACLSHYSAASAIPLMFVSKRKSYGVLYVTALAVSAALAYAGIGFGNLFGYIGIVQVQSLFEMYSNQSEFNAFNMMQYGRILICLFCWYVQKSQEQKLVRENFVITPVVLLKTYTVGLVLAFLFADLISLAIRFSELLLAVEILMIPMYFSVWFRKNGYKIMISLYSSVIFAFSLSNSTYFFV